MMYNSLWPSAIISLCLSPKIVMKSQNLDYRTDKTIQDTKEIKSVIIANTYYNYSPSGC